MWHTLDLIFGEINSELNLHNCTLHEFISYHTLVTIDTTLNKAPWKPNEKTIRDTTRLNQEILGKYYTTQVIENNARLEQACDQFNEELHIMPDWAASQKGKICGQGKNHDTRSIFMNKKELSKTGIISTKTQRRSPLECLQH